MSNRYPSNKPLQIFVQGGRRVIHLPMACLSGLSGGSTNTNTLMAPRTTHGTLSKYAWKPARRRNVNDSRNVTRRDHMSSSPSSRGVRMRTESLLIIRHSPAFCMGIQFLFEISLSETYLFPSVTFETQRNSWGMDRYKEWMDIN